MNLPRRTALGALLASSALLLPGRGSAQPNDYPNRPIRLVLPFTSGGPTDLLSRLFAEALGARLNTRVLVENRTGAGSTVGADVVAKSPKDGYTLLFTNLSHTINPWLYRRLPFDPQADFAPVATLMEGPVVVLVHKDAPFRTLADLIAAVRARPNHYDYGSAGTGASSHVSLLQILSLTGAKMNHVVYRGAAPAMTDLMSGTITSVADTTITALGNIRGGMVRPLAITSPERASFLPDVPTVRESGLPELANFSMSTWNVLLAPVGTPAPILDRLHEATRAVMTDPAVIAKFAEVGNVPMPGLDQAGTRSFMATEAERWREVMQSAGVQPE